MIESIYIFALFYAYQNKRRCVAIAVRSRYDGGFSLYSLVKVITKIRGRGSGLNIGEAPGLRELEIYSRATGQLVRMYWAYIPRRVQIRETKISAPWTRRISIFPRCQTSIASVLYVQICHFHRGPRSANGSISTSSAKIRVCKVSILSAL